MKVKVKIGVPDWCLDEYSDYIKEIKESVLKEYAERFSDQGATPNDISVETLATDGEFYTKFEVDDGDADGIHVSVHEDEVDGIPEGEENPRRNPDNKPCIEEDGIEEEGKCIEPEPYDGLPIDIGPLVQVRECPPRSLTRFEQILATAKLWGMLDNGCSEELHTEHGTFFLDRDEKAYLKGVLEEATGIDDQIERLKEYASKW